MPNEQRTRLTDAVATLTRSDLADAIGKETGFSRAEAQHLIDSILRLISVALQEGENVKIVGFGTFVLRDKAERIGRNPRTGLAAPVTARRVLTFRASRQLKERIAKK